MQPTVWTYLIVCPLVFLAGFVDSVAGGGGVISLPAYLIAGLPVKLAAGTNKLANGCGTALAAAKYAKSGNVDWYCAIPSAVFSLLGSAAGTSLAVYMRDEVLKIIILAALPAVAVLLLFIRKKDNDEETLAEKPRGRIVFISSLIGLGIGVYDGLIGPGTGTFLTLAFSLFLGFSLLRASGCARMANLASNISSLIVYLLHGDVLFAVGIPAIACSMLGNYLGSRFAIRGGSAKIRLVMFGVLALLFIKTALELTGVMDF
ncbi:MAG: sulfite exporter TauE/SafE family protein [Clostridia bacterium]|nr:sulfite exporter TauE/SafE family protein [Clostridia bacterium]